MERTTRPGSTSTAAADRLVRRDLLLLRLEVGRRRRGVRSGSPVVRIGQRRTRSTR
jgi:hypothetical protein